VSSVNKQGFLTFNTLGSWSDQVLLAQRVVVRTSTGSLRGIIASKPPHLMPPNEMTKVVTKDKMFIDIGASNEHEAKSMGVRIGDPVIPDSRFSMLTKTVFKDGKRKGKDSIAFGKAFDNRVGAWAAAEVIRRLAQSKVKHPNTVIGVATTQEEEGLRGAQTTANLTKPDVCLVLDSDIAGDVPGIEDQEAPAKMGRGPSITTADDSMIPNQELLRLVIDTAETNKIPYQLAQVWSETDAGPIHMANAGCPTLALGVPVRHVHSNVGLCSLTDAEDCVRLIVEVVKCLDKGTVNGLTKL